MRLSLSLLYGGTSAAYQELKILQRSNTVSNGMVAHSEASFRPYEASVIDNLKARGQAVVDVNVARLTVQNSASHRLIRKYKAAHGGERANVDYLYVMPMQIIYEDAAPNSTVILMEFPDAVTEGSADWTTYMDQNTDLVFEAPGMLHGDCSTAQSECQNIDIQTDFCYDTHVIPFSADSQAEYDDRAANVSSIFKTGIDSSMSGMINFLANTVTVNSITPNFPAGQVEVQTADVTGSFANSGSFSASWEFTKTTTENIHTVCMTVDTALHERIGQPIKDDDGWSQEATSGYIDTLDSSTINSQSVGREFMCKAPTCDPAPVPTRCEGIETYNEDLSDNGFLSRLGQGMEIVKVISGRGYLGKPPNKPAVGYFDEPYGNDVFHLVGDTVRIGCKLGYANGVAKDFVGAVCECSDGVCQFNMVNPEYVCVSEQEQAMPVWTGGVFNFVKAVYSKYIVLKARVANLLSVGDWTFDRVDVDMHPEYLQEDYWKTANFTLFVFCPFDVTLGGVDGGTGLMTFPDFYPGEHSKDGMLWSFLSREGTKLWKPRKCLELPDGEIKCVWRSSYYKGFIDRSAVVSEQGPIEYNTGFQTEEDYSCETGILAGHHPFALYNLEYYFPAFTNGSFSNMANYLRNAPFTPTDLE